MRYSVLKLAGFSLPSLVFAGSCFSASQHELNVGAQKEQICSATTVRYVGKFLKIDALKISSRSDQASEESIVSAAACKATPQNAQIVLAAIAYDLGKENTKALIVALIDKSQGRVISSYRGEIDEDAAMRVTSGSLWIDTAPYDLAPGVRAVGLDVTSGYIANCGDGGTGATRMLFVREGGKLRPVLEGLTMSYWTFIQQARSRCVNSDDAPETSIIENTDLSIAVDDTSTNGYRDLIVTAVSSRDDGKKIGGAPFRYRLHYDGRNYSIKKMIDYFYKWRP